MLSLVGLRSKTSLNTYAFAAFVPPSRDFGEPRGNAIHLMLAGEHVDPIQRKRANESEAEDIFVAFAKLHDAQSRGTRHHHAERVGIKDRQSA